MMNKPLPEHLRYALELICSSSGEDIGYALGHLHRSTAFAYMSKLKDLGLAYTYCKSRGDTEVWPTRAGTDLIYGKSKHAAPAVDTTPLSEVK